MAKKLILFLTSAAMSFCIIYFGCGSDENNITIQNQTTDTNVVIIDSIDVFEFFNQTSMSGVDLLRGRTTTAADTAKDMQLVDSLGLGMDFYFRSGDLSVMGVVAPGEQTRFNSPYSDITKSQFDTLSVIPDSDNNLDSLDFTQDDTRFWGYFRAPLTNHRVYGFYLKGKYAEGYTSNRVYGVIYLRNSTAGLTGFVVNIAVKINKAGQNKFVK